MVRREIMADQAFALLKCESQNTHVKLRTIAQTVIQTGDLPSARRVRSADIATVGIARGSATDAPRRREQVTGNTQNKRAIRSMERGKLPGPTAGHRQVHPFQEGPVGCPDYLRC
jgi:hypothetical protein